MEPDLLSQMCQRLQHRGPDDQGAYQDSTVHLGMTRLSIIDLERGHQPIANEDQTVWIVFNGEIYNFRKLRTVLEGHGHRFCTNTDTEVLVHAYEEWDVGCLERLEGMFAFAIWDTRRQRLFLARDRLGKKPLYYFADNQGFVFASEMKALLACSCVPRRLNFAALDFFLSLGYVPAPYSMLEQICKLPAAHYLLVDQEGVTGPVPYWRLTLQSLPFSSFDEAQSALRGLLDEAVHKRLIAADVPVGVLLSGGIDSSTVTALAAQHSSRLQTFSVGFAETALNELDDARRVARHFDTEHHEVKVERCSPDLFQHLTWHMDEPSADPAIVPTYLVCRLARQSVKVVLTGEGGDEVFGGYPYYRLEIAAHRMHRFPKWTRRALVIPGAKFINFLRGKQRYHPRTLWNWSLPEAADLLAWIAVFTDTEKNRLLAEQRFDREERVVQHLCELARQAPFCGLERYLYLDLKLGLADGLLTKVDRMSMAASLEARTPYLDHRVVEMAFSLPSDYKLNHTHNKRILRRIAEDLLPRETREKPKQFFMVPERRWLTRDLAPLFWDLYRSQTIQSLGIFKPGAVEQVWSEMLADVPGASKQVLALLSFMVWYDLYLARAEVASPPDDAVS